MFISSSRVSINIIININTNIYMHSVYIEIIKIMPGDQFRQAFYGGHVMFRNVYLEGPIFRRSYLQNVLYPENLLL